jgi:hypothetical protein
MSTFMINKKQYYFYSQIKDNVNLHVSNLIVDVDEIIDYRLYPNLKNLSFVKQSNSFFGNIFLYLKSFFNNDFNQPVDNLPSDLKSLTFGNNFNQPVDNLPSSLESLTFGNNFNQPVDNLPFSLEYLSMGDFFEQELNQQFFDNHPNLKCLEINEDYYSVLKRLNTGNVTIEYYE